MGEQDQIEDFITRWSTAGGSERANYQLFVTELCRALELPQPEPARGDNRDNGYVFERRVDFAAGDGSHSAGFIDCYRRGTFVLEAKKVKAGAWPPLPVPGERVGVRGMVCPAAALTPTLSRAAGEGARPGIQKYRRQSKITRNPSV